MMTVFSVDVFYYNSLLFSDFASINDNCDGEQMILISFCCCITEEKNKFLALLLLHLSLSFSLHLSLFLSFSL